MSDIDRLIEHLPALVVVAFAAAGIVAIWTTDSLFAGTRERLESWAYSYAMEGGEPVFLGYEIPSDELDPPRWARLVGFLRGKAVDLVTCPRCSSWWVIFFAWWAMTGEVHWPWTEPVWWVEAFAARGAALWIIERTTP